MSETDANSHIESLRELWLTQNDLSYLNQVDPVVLGKVVAEVKAHRDRVEESVRPVYESMAKATRFLPGFVAHKLGRNMSPYVRARITEHMEPKQAAAMAKHIPPEELAEISLHLEAGRVAEIAAHQDVATLAVITSLLADRGLMRRLGEVSDALDERLLSKLIDRLPNPERLAAVAAHMTAMEKLERVARRLDKKLRRTVLGLLEGQGHTAAARAFAE